MSNHYHLVLCTRAANLSLLKRHLNGVYTQSFNHRHRLVGHLFQGRFKAILVDSDDNLMSVCRYVELNPVRARMVQSVAEWPWSSYRANTGQASAPDWLDVGVLHNFMLGRQVVSEFDRRAAQLAYRDAVATAPALPIWDTELRQQIFLGSEDFVVRAQARVDPWCVQSREIPRAQRAQALSLSQWLQSLG